MNNHLFKRADFNDLTETSGIELIKDLITQSRPNEWVSDYPNTQDLHELLALEEVKGQTIVWLDDIGEAKAFCIIDIYNNLLFDCVDFSNYTPIFKEAVQFGTGIIKKKYHEEQIVPTLDACCRKDDYLRVDSLTKEGFEREAYESISFKRALLEISTPITLPPGFIIRPLNGEHELNAYVDLHQKAFGTSQMTQDFRRSIMSAPEYDPQLDLVVQSPEGILVAFCVCQINESENIAGKEKFGWTDPIGVHPDFRKLGLAKALLIEGFLRLKARGLDYARLGTRSDNLAMIHLAEAMGFLESGRKLWFSREI